ncbi:uncharacterized protein BDZ99DRAFT_89911 [Mytilinidion resinicola]|uniref:Uncharacterized protein n=1 Tax=Mytilinidion resinicola TaxID=574789 RepID=A0A6A6YDV8_9PEZI|nr:uncharacterized protein BDZ99DRAFT_89911 [Mytilinidion resinicola]KAF2807012.1 hypothetical protein BDZ99DRAFT_89911 [Mytilinidion resinicola]
MQNSTAAQSYPESTSFFDEGFVITAWALVAIFITLLLLPLNVPTWCYIRSLHKRIKKTGKWDDIIVETFESFCCIAVCVLISTAYIIAFAFRWDKDYFASPPSMLEVLGLAFQMVISLNIASAIVFGLFWGLIGLAERFQASPKKYEEV